MAGDLSHIKTDKVQQVTGDKEYMKTPQSGLFVVLSCFRPVSPDAKYNMAQISLNKISNLELGKFFICTKKYILYMYKYIYVHF
jgi:hypothetical protein